MPVARKVWLPIGAIMPAATTRRRITRQRHRLVDQQRPSVPGAGPKQSALAVLCDAGRRDVGVQRLGERVVTGHNVMFAAFLMQPDPSSRHRAAGGPPPSFSARRAAGGGRIVRHHLAGDQPIEQHAHRGEQLFHAGRRMRQLQGLM